MSPEEAAREWLREEIRRDAVFGTTDTLRDHYDGGCFTDPKMGHECSIVRALTALLLTRESAAREEERERAVKIIKDTPSTLSVPGFHRVAAAIRGGAK